MTTDSRKFLLIGGGLAGITVATHLRKKGAEVTLIDRGRNYSTVIAAGMINPIVFRRMTKSWRVDEFLPYLVDFYRGLEDETQSSFFHPVLIRRLFSSNQERNFWLEKEQNEQFVNYLSPVTKDDMDYRLAKNPFGSGRVKQSYFVEPTAFFDAANGWMRQQGRVWTEEFSFDHLDGTTYKGERFDDVIFCVGHEHHNHSLFSPALIDQTKGQTLTIRSSTLPSDVSLNRKCFVLPKGDDRFKIGSTYEWHNSDPSCTVEGREALLEQLSFLTDDPVEVLEQGAGIRPTTRDRRPVLGTHPDHPSYHIFNGLGAKGYMIAPLLAKEFVEYLYEGVPLSKEVNVLRYFERKN